MCLPLALSPHLAVICIVLSNDLFVEQPILLSA